jgi:hypothetical protein
MMKVSYDLLKDMIMQTLEEFSAADSNEMLKKYGAAKPYQQTTRQYCKKLVGPEMRKDFINQLDTLEKASKGNLKKKVQEVEDDEKYLKSPKSKNKNMSKSAFDTPIKNSRSRKLSKDLLVKIISEVLEEYELTEKQRKALARKKNQKKEKKETDLERRSRLFPGYEDLHQLQMGIMEEEDQLELEAKKKKKKNCSRGAPYHNANGEFSSKRAAKSWSLKFASKGEKDCKGGQARVKDGKELFAKLPCGRGDEDGNTKAKYKCKDGELAN